MRKTTALALLLTLALALPAGAAARVVAPPGLPEAEQYYETIPTSTGPRAPDTTKKAHDAVLAGVLSQASEHELRRRGANGLSLATAVAQTAEEPGARPQPPALASLGERGLGGAFSFLLALTAVAAAAFAVSRRRHPSR